jgi:hypothetical protein
MKCPRRAVVFHEWNPRTKRFRVKMKCGHFDWVRAAKGGNPPKTCGCFTCAAIRDPL